MGLKDELGLRTDFHSPRHEALLAVYYTTAILRKQADVFFGDFGLTDVQFNVLALIHFQGGRTGLRQVALSQMMLVNRANITALVDRMERSGLVRRVSDPADRRTKRVRLTPKGEACFARVYEPYKALVRDLTQQLNDADIAHLLATLATLRGTSDAPQGQE